MIRYGQYLLSMLKKIKKTLSYAGMLSSDTHDLRVREATDEDALLKAKELHARVFLSRGYITESDLTAVGLIGESEDPYQKHAKYFMVERLVNGSWRVCAISRL